MNGVVTVWLSSKCAVILHCSVCVGLKVASWSVMTLQKRLFFS